MPVRSAHMRRDLAMLLVPAVVAGLVTGAGTCLVADDVGAQRSPRPISAPIADVRYDVTVDSTTVARRAIDVAMRFRLAGDGAIVLSLPAWSPGHYTLLWFARRVSGFSPVAGARPLEWRLVDFQTWRITGAHRGEQITVSFSYLADTIDRAVAWTRPDFAFFNGTNLFLYPVGRPFAWPATVGVHTSAGWRIATGMTPATSSGPVPTYRESNYHDLADCPFFVGHFDLDSVVDGEHTVRLAHYPAGVLGPARMTQRLDWLRRLARAEGGILHDTPWPTYTVLEITDPHPNSGGLEHHNSQLDELPAAALDYAGMPALYAHEMFHSWNVKRLRPADLVPYRYDDAQPTEWLWESEGITDYYGPIATMRSGIIDSTAFLTDFAARIAGVDGDRPTALADASLQAWIAPTDGSAGQYYPKGSLAGFMLDIMIRDASDNRRSLDDVMRTLYATTYKHGRGFTAADWWGAVEAAAGGRSFASVNRRFVQGRDPYPWDSILPRAGLLLRTDTVQDLFLGVRSDGAHLRYVAPGSPAERAGLRADDSLLTIGGLSLDSPAVAAALGDSLRAHLLGAGGTTVAFEARRRGAPVTGRIPIEFRARPRVRLLVDPAAGAKAARLRHALFTG